MPNILKYINFYFYGYSLKRTMDIMFGGKVVCVCGYGEVSVCVYVCIYNCLGYNIGW